MIRGIIFIVLNQVTNCCHHDSHVDRHVMFSFLWNEGSTPLSLHLGDSFVHSWSIRSFSEGLCLPCGWRGLQSHDCSLGNPHHPPLIPSSHTAMSISLCNMSHHGPGLACFDISCVNVFVYLLRFD